MTLRTRLTLAFLLVVLLPLVVGTLLLQSAAPAALQARQERALTGTAELSARLLEATCARAVAAAGSAARVVGPQATAAQVRQAADRLVADGLADGVRLRDASGRVLAQAGVVPATAPDCRERGAAVGTSLTARLELRTAAGAGAGTAEAALRLDRLLPALRSSGQGRAAVVSEDGQVLVRTAPVDERLLRRALTERGRLVRDDGQAAVASRGQGPAVVVVEPLADLPALLPVAAAVLVGGALLAAAIAVPLARATTRPLEELGEAANRIASGDLSTTIPVRGSDEVARLATAFNGMTTDLRTYVGALEESRDELRSGLARLGDTLSSTHDLDRILAVVLETAMAATRAQGGMVLLLSPAKDELLLAVSRGVDVPEGLRLPVGSGIAGRVAQQGEALRGRTGDGPGLLRQGPGEPPVTSVVSVPFKSGRTLLGVLDLYDRADAEEFDADDLASVRTFATQATVAVDNVLLHRDVQRMAVTDGLTGLGNRRSFNTTITKETERAARFGRSVALLLLDLDLFKQVNDVHGHQRGDAVLVELAGRVKAEVRDVDSVARYGGEEVVVVLPETDHEGAAQAAERICEAVRRRPFGAPGEEPLHVTVSIGVAVFPQDGSAPSALLRAADEALYVAKRAGRDTWRAAAADSPADGGTGGRGAVGPSD